MKPATTVALVGIGILALSLTASLHAAWQPAADVERALGTWRSTERFEDEPRITVAFRRNGAALTGWAVLLGQHRKGDHRATLGLSFTEATWTGQSVRFSTILPEDEGTIGWELRVLSPTTALLVAMTEDGQPIQEDLRWDMRK